MRWYFLGLEEEVWVGFISGPLAPGILCPLASLRLPAPWASGVGHSEQDGVQARKLWVFQL